MPLSESTPMCNFIPKYHWFPLRRLVHLGIPCSGPIPGRRRGADDTGINHSPLSQLQSFRLQMAVDLLEQPPPQRGRLQPVAEVENRRLIGDRVREPEPHEALHGEILVQRVLHRRVAEVVDQLHDVHPQHQ